MPVIVQVSLDPLLIFGLRLGVDGAALATVGARLVVVATGVWGASWVHGLIARPSLRRVLYAAPALLAIAGPAILTNLAAPVGNGYAMHIFSQFGEATVAATGTVDVSIDGSGDVNLALRPAKLNSSISGSGEVHQN